MSSVCLYHVTRNFWKFCNTSIPVPESSKSSVRFPYPYPESTNPREHNLETFHHLFYALVGTWYSAVPGTRYSITQSNDSPLCCFFSFVLFFIIAGFFLHIASFLPPFLFASMALLCKISGELVNVCPPSVFSTTSTGT